jgi:signal transduction histidine kinase
MDKIKILIAEDSITQAMQLQHILAENNYEATIAANGREALGAIGEFRPSLVISDIIMPEMDGFELCRNIKTDEKLMCTPVILLTSLADPQDVIRALQCGADQFVTKPYEEKHLLATIKYLLNDKNLNDRDDNGQGIHISTFRNEKYLITSNRRQILNLLLSTYETAMAKNLELIKVQDELKMLNKGLEDLVNKRTAALKAKNDELNTVLQQLWQAAKLATMGELAASIAHELNNPLATVSLRIESLMAQTVGEDPRRRELEIIGQEVERMGKLVANLLQFSRRSQQQISTVNVCDEIDQTLELIHYHLRKKSINIVREFAPEVPAIMADRQQLRQLFLNLFTNAGDAMPQGGTLTIRVYAQGSGIGDRGSGIRDRGSGDRGQGSGAVQAPAPRPLTSAFIVVEIADTGEGIPPDILPKVMEPFYTTKPEGKGTGLGLAICRRIVQEHGGTLQIISEGISGKGTNVRITLSSTNHSNSACMIKQ